jgi:hypothetical protein
MKVSDLPVAEDVKDVTVLADAWGQGVVVTLLSRKINDNCVENQAKLIIYVHQTLLKMYYTKRLIIPYWNISLSQVYFPQHRT